LVRFTRTGRLGEADLLRQQRGVPEGGNHDQLVADPLGGLGELDVERLSRRRDYLAVRKDHLPGESSRDVGDHGDPVAASELNRVWVAVHINIGEHAEQMRHRGGVRSRP
jgi:hypothetical protein